MNSARRYSFESLSQNWAISVIKLVPVNRKCGNLPTQIYEMVFKCVGEKKSSENLDSTLNFASNGIY